MSQSDTVLKESLQSKKKKMKDEKVRSMKSNIRLEKKSRENSVLSY